MKQKVVKERLGVFCSGDKVKEDETSNVGAWNAHKMGTKLLIYLLNLESREALGDLG